MLLFVCRLSPASLESMARVVASTPYSMRIVVFTEMNSLKVGVSPRNRAHSIVFAIVSFSTARVSTV